MLPVPQVHSGCPIGPEMDLLPSQIMRLAHLGLEGEVLESESIWLCASCEACTTRCPMEIDIAAVMDALRILAVERKADIATATASSSTARSWAACGVTAGCSRPA